MPKFSNQRNHGRPGEGVRNLGGGRGVSIHRTSGPFDSLVMKVAKPNFSEPTFYGSAATGRFKEVLGKNIFIGGLTNEAVTLLEDMIEAAHAEPEMFLRLACYTRNELKVRTTPQIMLAVAAAVEESRSFVRRYASKIMVRPDDLKETFAAFRSIFQTGTRRGCRGNANETWFKGHIPHALRKALCDKFATLSERDILRYWGDGHPTFGDVLVMVYGSLPKNKRPVSKEMFNWMVFGELPKDRRVLSRAQAWNEFSKCRRFDEKTKDLALEAGVGWEVIASQFPTTEAWEWIATAEEQRNGKSYRVLSAMATLRNLHNMEKRGISSYAKHQVARAMVDAAPYAKILPMRYYSALQMVTDPILIDGLHDALSAACDQLPKLPGKTAVVVDVSASMRQKMSEKSTLMVNDVGLLLGAMVYSRSDAGSVLGMVASRYTPVPASRRSTVMDIMAAAQRDSYKSGRNTDLTALLRGLDGMQEPPERIVCITDSMSWLEGHDRVLWGERSPWPAGYSTTVQRELERYRQRNGNVHFHEIHMVEYDTSVSYPDKYTHVYSAYSEALVGMIRMMEGIDAVPQSDGPVVSVGTVNVEQLREELLRLYP